MKTRFLTTALLAAVSLTSIGVAAAQTPAAGTQQAGKHEGARHHHRHAMRHRGGDRIDALARLDSDGDGRLSRAELEAAQQAWQARRDAHRAARVARAEAKPGTEAAEAGVRSERHPQRGHRWARHTGGFGLLAGFDAIDANHDGGLSRGELQVWSQARAAERRAAGDRRFEAKFAEADLDKDGRLSRVEVSEKMPRLSSRFAWLDENGDGALSLEELRPNRAQR